MKIGQEEIKAIPPGTKAVFKVDHPKQFNCIKSAASYVHLTFPELGVRYSTSINRPKMEITVEAIPVDKKLKK